MSTASTVSVEAGVLLAGESGELHTTRRNTDA